MTVSFALKMEKDYKKKLMALPEFNRWLATKGRLLNGVV